MFQIHVIHKKFQFFIRFKQNKNIDNVTPVNHSFKLRRTFIQPFFFLMTEKGASVGAKGEPIVALSI